MYFTKPADFKDPNSKPGQVTDHKDDDDHGADPGHGVTWTSEELNKYWFECLDQFV